MRFAIALLMTTVLLNAAEPQAKKPAPATAPPAKRVEIPAGAEERQPGRFFYTDKDGKKWIFMRTPMGISRMEDKPGVSSPAEPTVPLANVKVTESGDMVMFERPSPFGAMKWQKKRADLNEDEKAALLRSQEDSAKPAKPGDVSTKQDR